MKLIPILFSTPMVIAVNSGTKDVTRRTKGLEKLNEDPDDWQFEWGDYALEKPWRFTQISTVNEQSLQDKSFNQEAIKCPYGAVGDVLWVRETWAPMLRGSENEAGFVELIRYTADGVEAEWKHPKDFFEWHNRPNIHMPYSACRKWLEIVSVKPERLHDITEEEAIREGVLIDDEGMECWNYIRKQFNGTPEDSFESLWISINGQESWDSNPWVWRVEFKPTQKPPSE